MDKFKNFQKLTKEGWVCKCHKLRLKIEKQCIANFTTKLE